jgi:hypothetical protein
MLNELTHTLISRMTASVTSTHRPCCLLHPSQCTPAVVENSVANETEEDAGYFASIQTLPLLGLGILGLMPNGGEVFDGTGIVGLRERPAEEEEDREDAAAFESAQQVSRALVEEVALTFRSAGENDL